ncbi:hypothetical protein FNB15_06755 [Ferrovibrio terrae]|uniref:Uncharacterized protein n=1 Tax=Ferrovibrio terrae TaxID=2594003 RepID=A0A516H076_9PROT|nr:hypothetical protein [Ferrovibrio terrae]QDO96990.1 hypothetical protein FNB15_06755 [Ferrovibrio terrae]
MTPAQLEKIGIDNFGPQWQSPLARVLRVDARTVRAWISGQNKIPVTASSILLMLEELAEFAASDAVHSRHLVFRLTFDGFVFPALHARSQASIVLMGVPDVPILQILNRFLLRYPKPKAGTYHWRDL